MSLARFWRLMPSSITLLPMITSNAPLLNLSLRFWRAALLLATCAFMTPMRSRGMPAFTRASTIFSWLSTASQNTTWPPSFERCITCSAHA